MKTLLGRFVDIEIGSDIEFNRKINVLLFNRVIATFKIEQGSTLIEKI